MNLLKRWLGCGRLLLVSEDGPTAVEYAILLAVLVLVAVSAIQGIGTRIYNVYAAINDAVPMGTI
jgi:pilus assembly protein Flp/PilA